MTKIDNGCVVKLVQGLYQKDTAARQLFDRMAIRRKDAKATSIDWVMRELALYRGDAIALMKAIAATDCAELLLGRRGSKTRLVWLFSCVSVGQAAAGETAELEPAHEPESENDEEYEGTDDVAKQGLGTTERLTIGSAKRLLARSLGIDESSIEISIRA
jgi:hypothetical protein